MKLDARGSIDERDIPPGIAPLLTTHDILPALPSTWETVSECPNGRRYRSKRHGLSVIASGWRIANRDVEWHLPRNQATCEQDADNGSMMRSMCVKCPYLTCNHSIIAAASWLHVSLARRSRRPELSDVDLVVNLFGLQDGVMLLGGSNVLHIHKRLNGPTLGLPGEMLR